MLWDASSNNIFCTATELPPISFFQSCELICILCLGVGQILQPGLKPPNQDEARLLQQLLLAGPPNFKYLLLTHLFSYFSPLSILSAIFINRHLLLTIIFTRHFILPAIFGPPFFCNRHLPISDISLKLPKQYFLSAWNRIEHYKNVILMFRVWGPSWPEDQGRRRRLCQGWIQNRRDGAASLYSFLLRPP